MTSVSSPALSVDSPGGAESDTAAGMSLEQWHRSLARNLDTAFLCTRAALPGMRAAGWGRVVMVASVTGPVMAMQGEAAYAAAKAGMVGLARSVALDFAREGVTANAVAPGWIATSSQTTDEVRQGRLTPVGRSARPRRSAAVGFLCTPGASYVTAVPGRRQRAPSRGARLTPGTAARRARRRPRKGQWRPVRAPKTGRHCQFVPVPGRTTVTIEPQIRTCSAIRR
jgi:hypothetical protein